MVANHVVERIMAGRGPFYRKLCISIAEGVAQRSTDERFRDGCLAVADEIRKIDEPVASITTHGDDERKDLAK